MKNYQKLYYQQYYSQALGGQCDEVSRRECFAPAEEPNIDNPNVQRWFYDIDAGYAVRLARTEAGDELGKRNAADLKAEERYQARQSGCVGKYEVHCPVTCDSCPLNNDCKLSYKATGGADCPKKCEVCSQSVSRTFELDRPVGNDEDGMERGYDLPDDIDITDIVEDSELLSALLVALDKLSSEDRELWGLLKTKTNKQTVADRFHLTLDGVRYREQRLFKILRSDEALKSFFENI